MSTDDDVELPFPTSPLYRATDPATSRASAQALKGSASLARAQRRALEAVRANPGASSAELASFVGDADPRKINRRLSELRSAGVIANGKGSEYPVKHDPTTGRIVLRWWPV